MKKSIYSYLVPLFALVILFSVNTQAAISDGGQQIEVTASAAIGEPISITFMGEPVRHVKVRMISPRGEVLREYQLKLTPRDATISIPTTELNHAGSYTIIVRTFEGGKWVKKVDIMEQEG